MKNAIKKAVSFIFLVPFIFVFAVNASALTLTPAEVIAQDLSFYAPTISWVFDFGNAATNPDKDGSLLIEIPDLTNDPDYGFYQVSFVSTNSLLGESEVDIEGQTFVINYSAADHPPLNWTLTSTGASAAAYRQVRIYAYVITDPLLATTSFNGGAFNSNIGKFDLNLTYSGEAFGNAPITTTVRANYTGLTNIGHVETDGGTEIDNESSVTVVVTASNKTQLQTAESVTLDLNFEPGAYESPQAGYYEVEYNNANTGNYFTSEKYYVPTGTQTLEAPLDMSKMINTYGDVFVNSITVRFVSNGSSAEYITVLSGAVLSIADSSGGNNIGGGGSSEDPGGDEPGANTGGDEPGANTGGNSNYTPSQPQNNYFNNYNTNNNYNRNYNELIAYLNSGLTQNINYSPYIMPYFIQPVPMYNWINRGRYMPINIKINVKRD
jgi:hypothetical protein